VIRAGERPAPGDVSLPKTQIRAYRWCRPPRIGCAMMLPNRSTERLQGASFPSARWVRAAADRIDRRHEHNRHGAACLLKRAYDRPA
jgi:hypothetical protein